MKCPNCDSSHKQKAGMKCACGYEFCFNPKINKMTDGKFVGFLKAASRNDTHYFTKNQLYAAFCRKQHNSPKWPLIVGGSLAGLAGALLLFGNSCSFAIGLGIVSAISLAVGLSRLYAKPPQHEQLDTYLKKWKQCGRTIDKLIESPRLHTPPPEWQEPDIYDYGVERLLIVERDILVDLFVRNNAHSEQKALILSENQYPAYIVPHAVRVLQDSPQLPIFLLHDATPQGEAMEQRLRRSSWLPVEEHPVYDMGLHPQDVRRMPGLQAAQPERQGYRVPVDLLLFSTMSVGLALAFERNLTWGSLLAQPQPPVGASMDFG